MKINMEKMDLDYLYAAARQCMEEAQELLMYDPDSSEASSLYEEAREYQVEAERRKASAKKTA